MDRLEEILEMRRRRVREDKQRVALADLEARINRRQLPADFHEAITNAAPVAVIAEMKKRSPSAGIIRLEYDVEAIAKAYEKAGARALSVLTETDWFAGSAADLEHAHAVSKLPILRKDFVFDPYQIVEARALGASAVLLIADMVEPLLLKELTACAKEYQLKALVEVFTPESLPAALESGSKIIGINMRNLRTLEMFPLRVEELEKEIPAGYTVVAESGIKTRADVNRVVALGVSAVLVGESLLKQRDLEKAVKELIG